MYKAYFFKKLMSEKILAREMEMFDQLDSSSYILLDGRSSSCEGGVSMDEIDDEKADLSMKLASRSSMEEAVAELATEALLPLLSPAAPAVEPPVSSRAMQATGESEDVSGRRRSGGRHSGGRRRIEVVQREALGREAAMGIGVDVSWKQSKCRFRVVSKTRRRGKSIPSEAHQDRLVRLLSLDYFQRKHL
jgi:hypothetical protein